MAVGSGASCPSSAALKAEHASLILTSNLAFSGWTETFADPRLCAAIVDRLTYGGTIIETGTTRYRLDHSRHRVLGK